MIPCLLRRTLAALLLPPLLAAPLPAAAQEAPRDATPAATTPQGTSTVTTWVRDEQGKDLPGVRVLLAPMEGKGPALASNPTDRFGECQLRNVSYGYYRYGVETPAGTYLGSRVLLVPPEREVAIEIDLGPFLPEDEKLGLSKTDPVPGTDKIPIGVAGGGILAVAGVILLTDPGNGETTASPSAPSGR